MCNLQKNVAIIDIGSNSVRIRISCEGKVFYRNTITTQLAKDISCGLLNEQSVKRTFLALDELIERANKENAQIYAFATAAVRNAVNGKAFCAQFFTRYNIELDVLSGKDEAQMGILGALQGGNGCVIDVGGASSELVIANNNRIVYAHSMQLGAVVLTDLCAKNIYDANLMIYGTFVIGYDNDTKGTAKELMNFAIENKFAIANFNPLMPMPDTKLYERLKNENRLTYEKWWLDDNYSYGDAMLYPKNMTPEELTESCKQAKFEFNSNKNIFKRMLNYKSNCKNISNLLFYLLANFASKKEIHNKQGKKLGK